MKFSYATEVSLVIDGIEAEELASVLSIVSDEVYGPECIEVRPEYVYDYYGTPEGPTGTYSVILKDGVSGLYNLDKATSYTKDSYETLNCIEKRLIE